MRPSETLSLICCSVLLLAFTLAAPVIKDEKEVGSAPVKDDKVSNAKQESTPEEQLKSLGSKATAPSSTEKPVAEESAPGLSQEPEEAAPIVEEAPVDMKPSGSKRGRQWGSRLDRQSLKAGIAQQAGRWAGQPQAVPSSELDGSQEALPSSWGYRPAEQEEENNGIEDNTWYDEPQAPVQPQGLDDDLRMALTPRAVAQYLLVTSDFGGFDDAVEDLVAAGIMSAGEVQEYKDLVGWEYEALLKRMVEDEAAEAYIQDYLEQDKVDNRLDNYYNDEPVSELESLRSPYMDPKDIDLELALQKLQMRSELGNRQMPDADLLNSVVEEYQNLKDESAPVESNEDAQEEAGEQSSNEEEELKQLSEAAKEHQTEPETEEPKETEDETSSDESETETSGSSEVTEEQDLKKKSEKAR